MKSYKKALLVLTLCRFSNVYLFAAFQIPPPSGGAPAGDLSLNSLGGSFSFDAPAQSPAAPPPPPSINSSLPKPKPSLPSINQKTPTTASLPPLATPSPVPTSSPTAPKENPVSIPPLLDVKNKNNDLGAPSPMSSPSFSSPASSSQTPTTTSATITPPPKPDNKTTTPPLLPATPAPISNSTAGTFSNAAPIPSNQNNTNNGVSDSKNSNIEQNEQELGDDIDLDSNYISTISQAEAKFNDYSATAKSSANEIDAEAKKVEIMLNTFSKEDGKRYQEFKIYYQNVKNYLLAQQKQDFNNEIKSKISSLDYSLKEFWQQLSGFDSTNMGIESSYKEILDKHREKLNLLNQIADGEIFSSKLKSESFSFKRKSNNEQNDELKKLESFKSQTEQNLTQLKNITSDIKGKAEALSGKVNQVKELLKGLDNKKEELEKILSEISQLKQKNSINNEIDLLDKLKQQKPSPDKKTAVIIMPKIDTNIEDSTDTLSQKEGYSSGLTKDVVNSFWQNTWTGLYTFIFNSYDFIKTQIEKAWNMYQQTKQNKTEATSPLSTPNATTQTPPTTPASTAPQAPAKPNPVGAPSINNSAPTSASPAPTTAPQNTPAIPSSPTNTSFAGQNNNMTVSASPGIPTSGLLDAFYEIIDGIKRLFGAIIEKIASTYNESLK